MSKELSYSEYCYLYDIGIVDLIQKHGKSGVVSKIVFFGGCLDILCNRKEGVVGSMLRTNHLKLLCKGKNERAKV